MTNNRYILGTDSFDGKVFSVCLFDAENNTIVISENIVGEKEFEKKVEEIGKLYNCSKIEEFEIKEPSKDRIYGKVPNISQALSKYLKTDKGKQALKDYLFEEDCIDYNLVNEMLTSVVDKENWQNLKIQEKHSDLNVVLEDDTIIVEEDYYNYDGDDTDNTCYQNAKENGEMIVEDFPMLEITEYYCHRHKYSVVCLKLKKLWKY